MENIHIDMEALLTEVKNKMVETLMVSLAPDDKTAKMFTSMFEVFRKHNIDSETALNIVIDLSKILKVEEKEND